MLNDNDGGKEPERDELSCSKSGQDSLDVEICRHLHDQDSAPCLKWPGQVPFVFNSRTSLFCALNSLHLKVTKFALEQAIKYQRGSRDIMLFL
jgi:hypothetical protein